MFPYQIYQALADERARNLMSQARGREQLAVARHARRGRTTPAFTLRRAASQLWALARTRDSSRATSARTSTRSAGPMGCVT